MKKKKKKGLSRWERAQAKPRYDHSICGAMKINQPDRDREQILKEADTE